MEDIEGVKISELPKASSVDPGDIVAGVVGGKTTAVPVALLESSTDVITIVEFNALWDAAP